MGCKRCGDYNDPRWGNETYCGQCLSELNPTKVYAREMEMDLEKEDFEGSYQEALRAYIPSRYRMCVEEEV